MSRKPENQFILSVHKYLPPKEALHREKMNNPYSSGTADWWYSGDLADIWVEYKYLPKLPVRASVLPDLSELQKDWLAGRYREKRRVFVVMGSPEGSVIYNTPDKWTTPISPAEFRSLAITRQELARWLVTQTTTGAEHAENTTSCSTRSRSSSKNRVGN